MKKMKRKLLIITIVSMFISVSIMPSICSYQKESTNNEKMNEKIESSSEYISGRYCGMQFTLDSSEPTYIIIHIPFFFAWGHSKAGSVTIDGKTITDDEIDSNYIDVIMLGYLGEVHVNHQATFTGFVIFGAAYT